MNRRDFLLASGAFALTPALLRAAPTPADTADAAAPVAPSAANPFGLPGVGTRPNIILVLCDDLGWGDLGCFWQNGRKSELKIKTPNLDRMAAEGKRLDDHSTCAPVCVPARASIFTGKHQGHCNVRDNAFDAPIDPHMTLATVLKAAGYATWHVGKWGIGGGGQAGLPRVAMPTQAGFDRAYYYPAHLHGHSYYHCYIEGQTDLDAANKQSPLVDALSDAAYQAAGRPAGYERDQDAGAAAPQWRRPVPNAEARFVYDIDLFTAKAKALIREHLEGPAKATPFFLALCHTAVHGSGNRQVADPAIACKRPFQVPGAPYPALTDDPATGGGADLAGSVKATADTANTWIHPDCRAFKTPSQRRYATTVRRLDDAMGDLLHYLRLRGIDRDTLVVFTSDNGPAGEYLDPAGIQWVEEGFDSNGPFRGMKRWSYQGGLREPTLVRWPAAVPPGVSTLPSTHVCWMPTFAEAAGLPPPAHADGVSLLPDLTGMGRQLTPRVYAEYRDGGSGQNFGIEQAVRQGDYALVRNSNKNGGKPELYDLRADPGQTHDLAAEKPDVVAALEPLFLTCRIPIDKVKDACGAATVGGGGGRAKTLDAAPLPALPPDAPSPQPAMWVYQGDWPWVPDFRALMPVHQVPPARIAAVLAKLPPRGCGVLVHGLLDLPEETEVAFRAQGAGGCQLWLHEAHILEYEAGGCAQGRAIALRLAKGRHPWRACLTAPFVTLTANGAPLLA